MSKHKRFMVYAKVENQVGVEVSATSLSEASDKAQTLKDDDFVEVLGEELDGAFRVIGVHEINP